MRLGRDPNGNLPAERRSLMVADWIHTENGDAAPEISKR